MLVSPANMESPFRSDALRNRCVLVTGGGSGIGFGIARQMGLHGAAVCLAGRREEFLARAVVSLEKEGVRAVYCAGDVRNPTDAARMVAKCVAAHGALDTVVNAAAGNFLSLPESLTASAFRNVLDIDTVGSFAVSTAAFPHLKDAGARRVAANNAVGSGGLPLIINVSATLHYGATWYQAHAAAAKAAIDSLTRSLALEWGHLGIRVVGIAPGPIASTPGMTKLAPGADDETIDRMVGEAIPLGRAGRVDEVALLAVYLSTRAADYVTGETVVIDGGQWLWRPAVLPREAVASASRDVEAKSRAVGAAKM
eukprot:TRINITY_DN3242_c0_g2_i1.p1 TRINITY_DN3242_c0_g2~~TRINITY_DN3242_c0_g2_i1.p1  ORF type:complete len:311 (-),score=56.87 TRINITY_DN3242_c0_g2_i1:396-1328(-)